MKLLNLFMLGVFLLSAAVQINDPDPITWIAIYVASGVACFLALREKLNRLLPVIIGLLALSWSVYSFSQIAGQVTLADIFSSLRMKTLDVELAREGGGLLIVTGWMLVLTMVSFRKQELFDDS